MKIRAVDTQLCRVPLRQRTITDSQSRVDAVDFLQVVLETDAGITGYGMNWSYTPGLRAAQVAVVDNYAPLLIGRDPQMRKQIVRDCYYANHFVGRGGTTEVGLAAVSTLGVSYPRQVALHIGCHGLRGLGLARPSEIQSSGANKVQALLETVRGLTPGQLREVIGGGNIMGNALPAPAPPPPAVP